MECFLEGVQIKGEIASLEVELLIILRGELLRETQVDTASDVPGLVFGVTDEQVQRGGSV